MSGFRELRKQMRQAVHGELQISALYIEVPGVSAPLPVNIRLHRPDSHHGGLQGTNFHYGERMEVDPKIIFEVAVVAKPKRGAFISIAEGEAYEVDHSDQPDGDFIKAHCTQLSTDQTVGLPLPEDA